MTDSQVKRKRADAILNGTEPVFDPTTKPEDMDFAISLALNHYRTKPPRVYKQYLTDWLKTSKLSAEDKKAVAKGDKKTYEFFAAAAYARLMKRGWVLTQAAEENFQKAIAKLVETGRTKIDPDESNKPTVQDYIRQQTIGLISELELMSDRVIEECKTNKKLANDLITWFKSKSIKSVHAKAVVEVYTPRLAELESVLAKSDPQLVEGYDIYDTKCLKRLCQWHKDLISLAKEQMMVAKSERKPRKKKVKTPEQLAAKIKLLAKHDELGLTSKPASDIIGASMAVLYDSKRGYINVYRASALSSGLSVKGKKIINFDVDASIRKKIKNPKTDLSKFVAGIRAINNAIQAIRGKGRAVNGRVSDKHILLQVN